MSAARLAHDAVTRWPLYEALADTGLPVESSSSRRTKFNRTRLGIPKGHALDAACVRGRGHRRMGHRGVRNQRYGTRGLLPCRPEQERFPTRVRHPRQNGPRLPDRPTWCAARSAEGNARASTSGGLASAQEGSFKVGAVTDINWKHWRLLQRGDGDGYAPRAHFPSPEGDSASVLHPGIALHHRHHHEIRRPTCAGWRDRKLAGMVGAIDQHLTGTKLSNSAD